MNSALQRQSGYSIRGLVEYPKKRRAQVKSALQRQSGCPIRGSAKLNRDFLVEVHGAWRIFIIQVFVDCLLQAFRD